MILDSSRGSSYLLAIGSSLKNPSAKILDTGNLVFGETNPDGNEGKILWQSFDYPTDSLLPYMKLVLNKSTGENHFLTSWRSAEDPAPGEYAFGVDTNDNINIWKNGISQWKSRARSGQIFTAAPDSSSSYILNFSSPSDEKLGSYSYTTNNNSVITRLVIRDLFNLQQLQDGDETGRDIYLRVARERKEAPTSSDPSSLRKGGRNKRLLWIMIGVIIPIISIILISIFMFYLKRRTKDKDKLDKGWNKDPGLHVFSFSQISAVTNNFSPTNKLGQGGFGPVYKGNLPGGEEIAVKRLLGCCTEGEEKMLIYEYMPNKSLDSFLFDPSKKKLLDWTKRIHIIDGIAQGLLYLHTFSRLRIIHRDLKASNILLDGEMNPKISDFGLARIVDQNESRANTNRVVGTYGYMSPEYAMEGFFSVKSDVYSFGVLLLEIVTGNKNGNFNHFDRSLNLLGYAWELWKEESASDRPSMSDVVSMLRNEVVTLPVAMKPAFRIRRPSLLQQYEGSKKEGVSINDASVSMLEAR
ncbi:hypothetical protein AAC387_Pa06g2391 [Persea americana]